MTYDQLGGHSFIATFSHIDALRPTMLATIPTPIQKTKLSTRNNSLCNATKQQRTEYHSVTQDGYTGRLQPHRQSCLDQLHNGLRKAPNQNQSTTNDRTNNKKPRNHEAKRCKDYCPLYVGSARQLRCL